jgi:5-methylthioadenosine/S-adenosylhomocysteine deaminase
MTRTLIRCGFIVSMDDTVGTITDGEILVERDRIVAIGRRLNATADTVIDAGDMIVLPGLVNMHLHTFQAGLRGAGSEWLAPDYFRYLYGDMSRRFTPQDNYLGTLIGALNQLNSGVTTLFDYCHNLQTLEQAERNVDALKDSGIRAVFGHGQGLPPVGIEAAPDDTRRQPRARVEALRKGRLASDDRLVTMALAVAGPHWGTWEVSVENVRLAREFGLIASSHVTRPHAQAIVPDGYDRMAAAGLLGPDHNLVHCQFLDGDELKRLLDTGASVTSTATNELHDHPCYPAAGRAYALGFVPTLGIDVEAMVSGDLWRELQTAVLFARNEAIRGAVQAGAPPKASPVRARDALAWVTTGAAKALRMEDRIGRLAPGRKADIVMLRATDLNLVPVHDPVFAAVEQAHSGNIDTVMVDGVIRKRRGRLLFDEARLRTLRTELAASAERLMHEAGYRIAAA